MPQPQTINVNVRHSNGCFSGCWTWLALLFALGLLIEAWQGSSPLERAGEVAFPVLAVLGLARWGSATRGGRIARRTAASTGRPQRASGEMLSHHLAHCDSCQRDLPCDEWDKLYDGPEAVGIGPGQLRDRLRDHLSECDRCDQDLPCAKWDELYAAFESDGGDESEASTTDWAPP